MATIEFFPGELFAALQAVIANNSDRKFIGVTVGKSGGYYAQFEGFENGEFIGYTAEQPPNYRVRTMHHQPLESEHDQHPNPCPTQRSP